MSYVPPTQAPTPLPVGKAVCPGDSHSAIQQVAIHSRKIHSTATSLPSPPEQPFPQVMTPTTDNLLLQVTLCFKLISQLNDPTKFNTPGFFGVLPTTDDVEQCPKVEQTQHGPRDEFKPCLMSHSQSYTKAVALSQCFRNSMEISFWCQVRL